MLRLDTVKLNTKIAVSDELINNLIANGWQEIENLQNQINNIEVNPRNTQVIQLLKNLLTSYYVFTGGLENLTNTDKPNSLVIEEPVETFQAFQVKELDNTVKKSSSTSLEKYFDDNVDIKNSTPEESFEPFEYFVDFDEPTGEPLSDEDLYGKNN
jgi:hypothetical protein